MKQFPAILILITASSLLVGCATTGKRPEEKRKIILAMKKEVLTDLYKIRPDVKKQIAAAPGYAVFSNANVNIIFFSVGGGYGVVYDKRRKKPVYMKMGEAGIGLGIGVKDFRAVFVFHNRAALKRFIDHGWTVGGHADAAAKASDKGVSVGGELVVDGITVYSMTKTGLALQITVKGTKYWKDPDLN
ncbi:MAG: hypothetical protein COB53_11685 [Elusimicrobia bacterium]|nr:MAG: hypothetical protein COB53_11685 [Elusimicrobiota bacterium]